MRKCYFLLLIQLFLVNAYADSFIVTKEGKGIWTSSVRKEGESLFYMDKTSGEEKSIPFAGVDGLVPAVQKGTQYKPEQVEKRVNDIKILQSKHPALLRDLNPLLQEWEILQKGDPGFGKQIEDVQEKFKASDKLTKAYKAATVDLGMIKFKDVQGKNTAKIDGIIEQIRKEYLAAGAAKLEAMAGRDKVTVDDFVMMNNLALALSEAGDAAQKQAAVALVEKARLVVLNTNSREALAGFAAGRSVEAYLVGHNILCRLKKEVAGTEDQKKKLDTMIAGIIRDAAKAQPSYSFDVKGYPFTQNDRDLMTKMQLYSSMVTISSLVVDEQCWVMPLEKPARFRVGGNFNVPLRLVFNRAQPKNRIYGVVVMIPGAEMAHTHTVTVGGLQVKDGHVETVFTDDPSAVDKSFVPGAGRDGRYAAYIYIVAGEKAEDSSQQVWTAISYACRLPM